MGFFYNNMEYKKFKCGRCNRNIFINFEVKVCPSCSSTNIIFIDTDSNISFIRRIIIGYYQWLLFYLFPKYKNDMDTISKKRWITCLNCKRLTKFGRCTACGCFMKIKTKGKSSNCKLNKWND